MMLLTEAILSVGRTAGLSVHRQLRQQSARRKSITAWKPLSLGQALLLTRQFLTRRTDKYSLLSRQEAKQQRMNGAANTTSQPGPPVKSSLGPPAASGKASKKDAASSRHKQAISAGKEGSALKGSPARPGGIPGREGAQKGLPKGSAKQPGKGKAGQGHQSGSPSGRPPKDAAHGKRDAPPKAPQQRPPTVTLEPTDLFL